MRSIAVLTLMLCCVVQAWAAETQSGTLSPEMLQKTETIAQALEDIAPKGWVAQGPIERYTVENLYDKINGRSELYMSYDVVGMTFVTLVPENTEDKTTYIDIFLYDMAGAENAFGVYGVERWEESAPIELGRDAYRTETDTFLWHGQYYATLLGSEDAPHIHDAAHAMAESLTQRLKDKPEETLWGMALMPEEKQVAGSLQYFKVDAMSLDFMTNTYSANYNFGGEEEVTFFLSKQDSEEAAQQAFAKYQAMFQKYGDHYLLDEVHDPPLASADLGGGYFDVVFQTGKFVGGISAVQDRATAVDAVKELFTGIKDKLK